MKTKEFLKLFKRAEKKYGPSTKRLAAEGWDSDWKVLITTIMSAQSRDETTIPIAENLFKKYPTLGKLAKARFADVKKIFSGLNYNNTKAKHVIEAAIMLSKLTKVPDTIEELVTIPGVGRKTANLVVTECYGKDGICVDTHVHRISNVLGLVSTKTPHQTEAELMKVAPKRYWRKINRIFVLWGKDCPGRDKKKLIRRLVD